MKLKLVKEPDNQHDKEAITVYLDDVKIGYVANNEKTSCNVSFTASELKNLPNMVYAKYLMNYQLKFHIARIIW